VGGRGRQATSNLDHTAPRQGFVSTVCEVHLANYLLSVQTREDKVEVHISASAHARSSWTRTISNNNMSIGAWLFFIECVVQGLFSSNCASIYEEVQGGLKVIQYQASS